MKSLGMIAVPIVAVALICGTAVSWHFVKTGATERKLAEDTKACRVRAEQGDANAQYDLASKYYRGKGVPQDYGEAFDWYRKAADQGNAKAQYGLARLYYQGNGVPQDYTKSIDWCRKAADQGYAKAQYALGYTYLVGKEVPQDSTEAVRWYRKAAGQGYAEAQSALGYMYSQGNGVPQDYTEAVRWYRKAADQGYARAQGALGYAYSEGKGVPRDYAEGARWYRKAAKQGDEYARHALDSMNSGFTTARKINLAVVFLGSMLLLISSRESIRNRQQRRVTLAGLLGLLWAGLDVYGYSHIGILLSLSAVNAFYFGKSLLSGICIAMIFSFAWPKGFKIMLGLCGALFVGLNIYATIHYDLRYFASCPRAFYSTNGLLIGMASTLAIFLWLAGEEPRKGPNGNNGVATETVAGSGIEPLRM